MGGLTLAELGFDAAWWADALDAARATYGDVHVARVVADHGVEHRVIGDLGDERATLAGRLRFEPGARPAVGDFVVVGGEPGSRTILDVLPRRSWLARQAAGRKTGAQIIAANLDLVFVVTSFNEDLNANRIERYLTAIADGGARGVVVVNKADLVAPDERQAHLVALRARLGEVPILVTSADDAGIEPLREALEPSQTASFVGSSGVGKSTLVNVLLGEEVQATGEVREADARGRHTTTHREMFVLANGAIVVDTPGMREFQIWDDGAGADAFDDIAELALDCRFGDCRHESEPGCAVLGAVEAGELDEARLESWRKLSREAEHQRLRVDEASRRQKERDFSKVVAQAQRLRRERGDE